MERNDSFERERKDTARVITAAYLAAAYSSWAYRNIQRVLRDTGLKFDWSIHLYAGYCDSAKAFSREAAERAGFGKAHYFASQCDKCLPTAIADFSALFNIPEVFKAKPRTEWYRENMTALEASQANGSFHYVGQLLAAAYIVVQVGFEIVDAAAGRLREKKLFQGAVRRHYSYLLKSMDTYTTDFGVLLKKSNLKGAFLEDYDRYRLKIMIILGVSDLDL